MTMSSPGLFYIVEVYNLFSVLLMQQIESIYEFAIRITSGTKHDSKFIIFFVQSILCIV